MPANAAPPPATYLESPDDIREALEARRKVLRSPKPGAAVVAHQPKDGPAAETEMLRPQHRPPLALLGVLDDGSRDEGEWIRLRRQRFNIGRDRGDLTIPFDGMMSGEHAALERQQTASGWRWVLLDLGSTNGTFIRVASTVLKNQNELLVGRGRYRLELPAEGAETQPLPPADAAARSKTVNWQGDSSRSAVPLLVELDAGQAVGQRWPLNKPEYWLGRDPQACAIARPQDLAASPKHARLYRNGSGHWHIESNKALNGVWLRVDRIEIDRSCQFLLGEQRFILKVL